MKQQHTPGPWHAEQNGELPDRQWTVGKLFYNVADVGNEADARLIASAPQLLEALEDILLWPCASKADEAERFWAKYAPEEDLPDSRTIYNRMIESARTAIAKAKGEQ